MRGTSGAVIVLLFIIVMMVTAASLLSYRLHTQGRELDRTIAERDAAFKQYGDLIDQRDSLYTVIDSLKHGKDKKIRLQGIIQ